MSLLTLVAHRCESFQQLLPLLPPSTNLQVGTFYSIANTGAGDNSGKLMTDSRQLRKQKERTRPSTMDVRKQHPDITGFPTIMSDGKRKTHHHLQTSDIILQLQLQKLAISNGNANIQNVYCTELIYFVHINLLEKN